MINNIPLDEIQNINQMNFNPDMFNIVDTTDEQGSNLTNNLDNINTELNNNFSGINDTTCHHHGFIPTTYFHQMAFCYGRLVLGELYYEPSLLCSKCNKPITCYRLWKNLMVNRHETTETIIDNIRTEGLSNVSCADAFSKQVQTRTG
ncbi:MAG: hypothetical protein U5L09_15125 [Bacteroidales bacterium]|nr:hypothetical protein [Bacteroidales bacterium]